MLLVVDGSSLLSSSYYGTLPNSIKFAKTEEEKEKHYSEILQYNGQYTNAVYSMLRIVLNIINNQKPSHIVFCFDKSRNTFRRKIYSDYKGTRAETPAPLKEQFVLMEDILSRLGFKVLLSDEYEADDYAGSIISKFSTQTPCVFLTKDRDYYQLVSDNTKGWMLQLSTDKVHELAAKHGVDISEKNLPKSVFEFTPDIVLSEEGVLPSEIVDKKAIVGDTSDNIPGVTGVSSAAAPLVHHYGSIENIYKAIDDCNNDEKSLKDLANKWKSDLGIKRNPIPALIKDRENCVLSKTLSKIKTDIDLSDISLDDLITTIDLFELEAIKNQYGFKTL